MVKTYMLLLAFTITSPAGEVRDEKIHVLSRHFDTKIECTEFVTDWKETIKDRGLSSVQSMLAKGWTVSLDRVGCTQAPPQRVKDPIPADVNYGLPRPSVYNRE